MMTFRIPATIICLLLLPIFVFGQYDAYKVEYRGYFFSHSGDSYYRSIVNDTVKCKCAVTITKKDALLVYEMKNSKCRGRVYTLKYKGSNKKVRKPKRIWLRIRRASQFARIEAILDTVNRRVEWIYDEKNSAKMPSYEQINFIFGSFSPKYEFKSSRKNQWEDFFDPLKGVWSEDKSTFDVSCKRDQLSRFIYFNVISKLQNPDEFWAASVQTKYTSLYVTGASSISYTTRIQLHRVK